MNNATEYNEQYNTGQGNWHPKVDSLGKIILFY